ncbi:hypothetical protein [Candidatus Solirubrobacter pratensis]|uniref:hypothetical protein n=1 Tax=Candidatus Solirubrobacter pratensis TaxID=1298857 RepID=UPI0003FB4B24|nr:hypothetical protein [Candidatus Solirubrobacter pratensis]
MLTAVIVVAAVAAGVTGAWSPCGFSMVETLAPAGYAGRVRTTVVACVTFTLGALAGGVVTFGGLSLLGRALGAGAPAVAALVALAAAAGEARGARIVPQVRRQVPESWRRVMPVPLAAGLYGVLLGLGFTTFILSFAVWALAGISVALGDPALGAAAGLAFGAGRALPVIALAPSGGGAFAAAMAERPRILRSLRAVDAAALAACAIALFASPAQAAATIAAPGFADPSADGATLALHRPGGIGELRGPAGIQPAPGARPAVGGGRVAWVAGDAVVVANVGAIPAAGVNAVAVSATYVAWRAATALWVAPILPTGFGAVARVAIDAGRPALDGGLLVFDVAARRIDGIDLATGARTTLRRQARAQLRGPSALNGQLVYVCATYRRQQVLTGPLARRSPARDRALYGTVPTGRRDAGEEGGKHKNAPGHRRDLWPRPRAGEAITLTTTATAADAVYVTRLRQRAGAPTETAVLRITSRR